MTSLMVHGCSCLNDSTVDDGQFINVAYGHRLTMDNIGGKSRLRMELMETIDD